MTEYLRARRARPSTSRSCGFNLVGYGCTTCIGNSGPLPARDLRGGRRGATSRSCSVLSGNRNFEGRINPDVKMNYLASPPLCVAYALAGTMDVDLYDEPLGTTSDGDEVFLATSGPSSRRSPDDRGGRAVGHVPQVLRRGVRRRRALELARRARPATASRGTTTRPTCAGRRSSRACRAEPEPVQDIEGARVLALLGDSVTTDHISPAGSIKKDSPAGRYLDEHGVEPRDFNSYGSRRGNHEVMMRGTFANIRLRNQLAPGTEGGVTRHAARRRGDADLRRGACVRRGGHAARRAGRQGVRLGLVARLGGEGHEAARRARGDRRVLRAHPPLQPRRDGRAAAAVPRRRVGGVARPHRRGGVLDHRPRGLADGHARSRCEADDKEFTARVRIDTPKEVEYFRHGGILQFVLRQLAPRTTGVRGGVRRRVRGQGDELLRRRGGGRRLLWGSANTARWQAPRARPRRGAAARARAAAVDRTRPAISGAPRSACAPSRRRPPRGPQARRRGSSWRPGSSKAAASAHAASARSPTASPGRARASRCCGCSGGSPAPARWCRGRRSRGAGRSRRWRSSAPRAGHRSGAERAMSRPRVRASPSARTSASMLRRRPSAPGLLPVAGPAAPPPASSSVRPSPPKTALAARPACSSGSGGNTNACTPKATAPPISASSAAWGRPHRRRRARADDDRRDARLGHQQAPAADEGRGRHGQHHHQPDLQRPVAEDADQQVGDHDAEGSRRRSARAPARRGWPIVAPRQITAAIGANPVSRPSSRSIARYQAVDGGARRLEDRRQLRAQPAEVQVGARGRSERHGGARSWTPAPAGATERRDEDRTRSSGPHAG